MSVKVIMAKDLLKANKDLAETNRKRFKENGILAVNIIGSPGAGKTSLLEKTIGSLKKDLSIAVIEGDAYTAKDAERIAMEGVEVVQINTTGGCHLDANMVAHAMDSLPLSQLDLVFIENVGNLVCPASFDLGEDFKVAVLSITEGDDKPAKYPMIFREADAAVFTKVDLSPYSDFNLKDAEEQILDINGRCNVFKLSARTGEGMEEWLAWLKEKANAKRVFQGK